MSDLAPKPIPEPPEHPRMFEVPPIDPKVARDAAVAEAEAHADPDWKKAAAAHVRRLAGTGRTFSADDVWEHLESQSVATHEPRALGAIITAAAREGIIVRVGYEPSRRPVCHGRPIAQWCGTDDPRDDGSGDHRQGLHGR